MNENNLKRIGYSGLGLVLVALIVLSGIFVTNEIFDTYSVIPDFVMTLFGIGLAICCITSLLRAGIRRENK